MTLCKIYTYSNFGLCKSYDSRLALDQDLMASSSTSQHQGQKDLLRPTGPDKLTVPETSVMATSFIYIMVDPMPFEFCMKALVHD